MSFFMGAGAVANSFSPDDLGTVLSWVVGDDATFERSESKVYSSLSDSGTFGSTWNAESNLHPVSTLVNGRKAAQFGFGRRVLSSLTVADWDIFTNTTDDVTLSARFYIYSPFSIQRYLFSTARTGTQRGIAITNSGTSQSRLYIFDGTTGVNVTTPNAMVTGWNTVQVTKTSGGDFSCILNGGTAATTSITTVSGDAGHVAIIGTQESSTSSQFQGIVSEIVIHDKILNATELGQMRDYFTNEWSAVPDYSPLQESVDVAVDLDCAQVATSGGEITTVYDESGHNNHQTGTADEVVNWVNGLRAAQGDATAHLLKGSVFNQGTLAQPFTIYTTFELGTYGAKVVTGGTNGAAGEHRMRQTISPGFDYTAGATMAMTQPTVGVRVATRIVIDEASSKWRLLENGGSESSGTGNPGSAGGWPLAATCWFGLYTAGTELSDSLVARQIIFAGIAGSDTAASDDHEQYLRDKYGITAA